jgi:hypothetical protein
MTLKPAFQKTSNLMISNLLFTVSIVITSIHFLKNEILFTDHLSGFENLTGLNDATLHNQTCYHPFLIL